MKTRRYCPKCGQELHRSRVPGYTYECKSCDEDFYRTEVHLIPDSEGEEKIIEDVYLDMLVSVIDENIEKTEYYGKRFSENWNSVKTEILQERELYKTRGSFWGLSYY